MRFVFFILVLFCANFSNAQNDTINKTDSLGRKQGFWKVSGLDKKKSKFKPHEIVEEGNYFDGKKTGVWTEYWQGNHIKKNEVSFVKGRPLGGGPLILKTVVLKKKELGNLLVTLIILRDIELIPVNAKYKIQEREFNHAGKTISATFYFPNKCNIIKMKTDSLGRETYNDSTFKSKQKRVLDNGKLYYKEKPKADSTGQNH